MQLFKMGGTITHKQALATGIIGAIVLLLLWYCQEKSFVLNVTHSIEEAVYLSNRIYILAPNPCKVQAVIDVNFDGRRTDAIRQTTAFANYVKQVEQVMSETHE